jgi:hypothetical protein
MEEEVTMHKNQDEENRERDRQKDIDRKLDWGRFLSFCFCCINHAANDRARTNMEPAKCNLVNATEISCHI